MQTQKFVAFGIGHDDPPVVETLGPAERAVFVLREVFDTPYDEIAEVVGKSPAAVRQIARRAREHVAAGAQSKPPNGWPVS